MLNFEHLSGFGKKISFMQVRNLHEIFNMPACLPSEKRLEGSGTMDTSYHLLFMRMVSKEHPQRFFDNVEMPFGIQ